MRFYALGLGLLAWLSGCKTEAPGPVATGDAPLAAEASQDLTLHQVADEPPEPPAYAAAEQDVSELKGFSLSGPVTCLPLPTGRGCLERDDPVAAACNTAQGELKRCEDCSVICSAQLAETAK